MRIAAISVAPVFPSFVIGGSQKILVDVSSGLKQAGHDVQIFCTGIATHTGYFEIDGVPVHPDLELRGSFPATHQVPPIALAHTAEVLRKAADWADRVYLHADAIYLRHAIEGAEIVRSIHDFVYEEALLSSLTLPANVTIVPSNYLKRCMEMTIAISGRTVIEPVITVPNGVHIPANLPRPQLPVGIDLRKDNDLILLFPHRPEPAKGMYEAISVAIEVQRRSPDKNVRLIMPSYPSGSQLDEATGTIEEISQLVKECDANEIVELHSWLSPSDMPGYYASGDVTLCVGSFIESFGLVPIESVANGTPAICARVGALRQFADVGGITLVDHGDVTAAAEAVLAAVKNSAAEIKSGREQIARRYLYSEMITGYESTITGPLTGPRSIRKLSGTLKVAPWCDVLGEQIYDDYAAESRRFPVLTNELASNSDEARVETILGNLKLTHEIERARKLGILVPEFVIK